MNELKHYLEAAKEADWQQVALNGGPPCFHLEDGRFCLRAHGWPGHDGSAHPFVRLDILLRYITGRPAGAGRPIGENTWLAK